MSSVALEAVTMLAVTVGLLAGGLALTIYVHEYGHYLAFRWVVGVPASDCRIVFAPLEMNYVALRDEDGWIDPFAEPNRHDRTLERYDPTVVDGTIVTAAGPVAHAVAIVSIALVVDAAWSETVAAGLVSGSLGLVGYYLWHDASNQLAGEGIFGDFQALWAYSRLLCVAVVTLLLGAHVVAVLAIL